MTKTLRIVRSGTNNPLPSYETIFSAGMDLRAQLHAPVVFAPGERQLIPTGLHIEIPQGYEGQIRPRSGLALKSGITVLNAPGTIDPDYLGDVGVILINLSPEFQQIHPHDRIAQLVIAPYEQVELREVEELTDSERGEKGFGSTGRN